MNFSKFAKIISLVLVICITVLAGIYTANSIINGTSDADSGTEKVRGKRINILIMATDKSGLRTDTIMFASFDKERKMVNIMSVPRDTRIKLNGAYNKVNAAYSAGKEGRQHEIAIEKVSDLIGLPVNYYVVIDPAGFRNVIDILGGVEIDVPQRMYYTDPYQDLVIDLYPGVQVLDGEKAEQFCRYRSGYVSADLGRIDAQQMFVKALLEQKLKPKYFLKASAIFDEIKDNITTNIGFDDVLTLLPVVKAMTSDSVYTCTLPGEPQTIGGASYYVCNRAQTDKLINEQFLNLSSK